MEHLSLCVTKKECQELNGVWWIFDPTLEPRDPKGRFEPKQCLNTCPPNYRSHSPSEGVWECEYCGSDCLQICNGTYTVDSVSAAQALKGCTFINGSLSIKLDGPKSIENELEANLGRIEEIRNHLKIYRSFSLRSLNFLKKLRVIHGQELESKRYAIIVYDNQNLQSLWEWDNFTLLVKRGTFHFHYNPKLCMSEIEKLREATKNRVIYSTMDVSPHSNGDKFACNYVNISTEVELIKPQKINLKWNTTVISDKKNLIGFLIYYIEAPDQNVSAYDGDACGEQGWRTIFVANRNDTFELEQKIDQLEPFTQYAFYVSIAYSTGKGGQSPLKYFKTLSSEPYPPYNIHITPEGSDTLFITWTPPRKVNGILSHYVIWATLLEENQDFVDSRNYCKLPMQPTIVKPVSTEVTTVAPSNDTKCCKKDEKLTVIQEIDEFGAICTDVDKFKKYDREYNRDCRTLAYHSPLKVARHGGLKMTKRTPEPFLDPGNIKIDGVYYNITKQVNGNKTSYHMRGLKHYSTYMIMLTACNRQTVNCSSVIMVYQRTGRKPHADDIVNPTTHIINGNTVDIYWNEPLNPNAVIVSYDLEYKNVEKETHQYIPDCITRRKHENSSYKYTIHKLLPGNYSVRIRTTSLAGVGNYSKPIYFYIPHKNESSTALNVTITVVLLFVVICGVVFYLWYRKKHQLDNVQLITTCNPDYVSYVEDDWEMDRDNIQLMHELGQGTFGTVFSGLIKNQQIPCAVKTVHEKANLHDKMEFLNEASVMKTFNDAHHVVRLLGVVSRGFRPLVVMELMARGDLKTYLRSTRDSSTCLTCNEMYRMAAEIADGMAYLSAKKFVHRDLAARNCMVSADRTVKIGDFGMTRDIYETDYYRKETRGLLPVRWMAPESLADGVFSAESDVWSYGIVLWEIATLAEQPYQGLANEQVLQFVINKGTLERPLQCPDLLFDIMEVCWKWRPSNRPLFIDIVEKLENSVGEDFKLMSFCHSREGEEFRMMKREVKNSTLHSAISPVPAFSSRNAAYWTKDAEDSCYLGSPRNPGPSDSYQSSNGYRSYQMSSS